MRTKLEQIKEALAKGFKPEQVAAVFQVSEFLVKRVQDRMKEETNPTHILGKE